MSTPRRPVIGITRSRSDPTDPAIFENYGRCVRQAGGSVQWLRPDAGEDPSATLGSLDGLLLTGGPDVDPSYYGEALEPRTRIGPSSLLRDGFEIPLVRAALQRDLPVLAICRGMQVLNVAAGGSLCQHVEGHEEAADGASAFHPVVFEPGSRLAKLLGVAGAIDLNSRHHQAVKDIAPGMTVAAASPDGIIEGMESARHRWVFAIQCHPERDFELLAQVRSLFAGLVEAAR